MVSGRTLLLLWVLWGLGCEGTTAVDDPSPLSSDAAAEDAAVPVRPAPWAEIRFTPSEPTLPRLTASQCANSVRTLFGDSVVPSPPSEPDVEVGGYAAIGAAVSTISPRGVENFERAAYAVARQIVSEPERARFVRCEPAGVDDRPCMEEVVRTQGRRIWRRPLTDDEVDRVTTIGLNSADTLGDFYAGLEFALAALLQSPHFLFRREIGEPHPDDPQQRRYTSYELAARLSFLLWNTTPDDTLLDAAAAGALDTEAGLRAEAERLLADPRARGGLARFFTEWLHLDVLDALHKDPQIYPAATDELGAMARTETLLTLEDLVFERRADFRDLLTQRRTFVNRKLAAMYAVRAPVREGFGPVELPLETGRRGLLGHVSVLASNAHPTSTSATLRGVFIRERLLCAPIPPPPADVDTSIPEPSGRVQTLRDRVAEHLENPSCSGCHLLVDPIGLGLENFDGLGVWRDLDNGGVIDPSGDFDGAPFADAAEFVHLLRDDPRFAACVVRQLFRYGLARSEGPGDGALLVALGARFIGGEHRLLGLVLELIASPAFRQVGLVEEEAP